ncbi:MAG: hypothetical protein H8E31_11870 [Planctomycetes bacterium]|nr:hypothetical protein [Planctomycetota bacterium]
MLSHGPVRVPEDAAAGSAVIRVELPPSSAYASIPTDIPILIVGEQEGRVDDGVRLPVSSMAGEDHFGGDRLILSVRWGTPTEEGPLPRQGSSDLRSGSGLLAYDENPPAPVGWTGTPSRRSSPLDHLREVLRRQISADPSLPLLLRFDSEMEASRLGSILRPLREGECETPPLHLALRTLDHQGGSMVPGRDGYLEYRSPLVGEDQAMEMASVVIRCKRPGRPTFDPETGAFSGWQDRELLFVVDQGRAGGEAWVECSDLPNLRSALRQAIDPEEPLYLDPRKGVRWAEVVELIDLLLEMGYSGIRL